MEETFKDLTPFYGLGNQEVRKWESCKAGTTITTTAFTAVVIETWKLSVSKPTKFERNFFDCESVRTLCLEKWGKSRISFR